MIEGDLGRFLRSRREQLAPADVGLPVGPRRRTPGLRRAEVAMLADVSVDYLVRLEQGKDRNPSAQVLAALADALRLGEADREHLRILSAVTHGRELCPGAIPTATVVRPTVLALMDGLEPSPAFVVNRLSDVLAWNAAFERVAGPIGLLDGVPPNLVRFTLADQRARQAFPDWSAFADEQVGDLRASTFHDDSVVIRVVEELVAVVGREFSDRWAGQPVVPRRSGITRLVHPEVGEIRVAFETLQLPDADNQRLVVYLPADEAAARALDRLAGRYPGGLRTLAQTAG